MQAATTGQPSALAEAQKAHDEHKAEFEKLRADVSVKLKFLNENRVKVNSLLEKDAFCLKEVKILGNAQAAIAVP